MTSNDLKDGETKRQFAAREGNRLAVEKWQEEYGRLTTKDMESMSVITVHNEDEVISELWIRGPEMVKVTLPVGKSN
ncbi:gp073 [Rhodococcus phage ReqiDocB7]|uniref:gp073 n=1 Tax=Rhodococcus phage ReqiDocB7 TaxID=691966 RepID=UPI0001CDD862|nr:gp073 [Rhodococcus phage ReqiDocB7]ADD80859.1 gp073 [Rhodococcus phage ReqiDocB7]